MLCMSVHAQLSGLVFVGGAKVKGGATYTYKLTFSDSNDTIKGYTVTDVMGPNETKTNITGTIQPHKQTLTFTEQRIVYTKSTAGKEDFCFLHATLKVTNIKGVTGLKGHFTGYKEDGKTVCAKGEMLLMSSQDVLEKLLAMAPKRDSVPEVVHPSTAPQETPTQVAHVLPGKSLDVWTTTEDVTLEVWDDKNIDGDVITLLHKEQALLKDYTLKHEHMRLNVHTGSNTTDSLTVIAVNEGSEPTNTARIQLTSGKDIQYIDATTVMGKPVQIVLKRK